MNTSSTWKLVALASVSAVFAIAGHPAAFAVSIVFDENDSGSDAGSSLDRAARVSRQGVADFTPVEAITGRLGSRADLFRVYLDGSTFLATTETVIGNYPDTQLYLLDNSGVGLYFNDNTPRDDLRYDDASQRSTIRLAPGTIAPGVYYLGISAFNWDPIDTSGNFMFPDRPRRALFTPSNSSNLPLGGWSEREGSTAPSGLRDYRILLKGVTTVSPETPTPTPSPTPTPAPSPTPSPTPTPAPSPTPSPTPTPIPTPNPTPTPIPTPTPSPGTSIPEPSAIAGIALGAISLRLLKRKR
ncbi:PEP-CTERM sorting domain-containing protein [Microcoleus sp. FACHB-1515]|uniref:PEP-CTERM sorting domain-containing protein n=1 Tax=Cyanophyceae TaxID=3028117 RepID=UPI0016824B9C|nr:PEP-CTERM sorting domain-containing protein [Microcoleus sp. FACHB-1515]MBD2089777.1 PEP-CTERM sorting domain-containing protein [Microcoleus sp. FACHB-1515]